MITILIKRLFGVRTLKPYFQPRRLTAQVKPHCQPTRLKGVVAAAMLALVFTFHLSLFTSEAYAKEFGVVEDLYVGRNTTTPYGGIGRYQNMLTRSENFTHADWTAANITPTNNQIAPNGVANSACELKNSTAAAGYVTQGATIVAAAAADYTFSVWLKAGTSTSAILNIDFDGTSPTNGASGALTLTSDWQRFSVTGTTSASSNTTTVTVKITNNSTTLNHTVLVWGAQLEQASTAGVYAKATDTAITAGHGIISAGDIVMPGLKLTEGDIANIAGNTITLNDAVDITGNLEVAGSLTITTGNNLIVGVNTLTSGDLLDATKAANADLGDISSSSGVWTIDDGVIMNIDVNTDAAIAGTKISPNFGSQNIITTGNIGIGTTAAATYKLDVNGTANFANNVTIVNLKTIDGRDVSVDGTKLDGIEALADVTDADNVAAAGAAMDSDFASEGLMRRGSSAGTYSIVTDNSSNWNTAYTHSQVAGGDSVHVSTTENTNWDTAYTHSSATTGTVHGLALADVSELGSSIESSEITDSTIAAADIAAKAITKPKLSELAPTANNNKTITIAAGDVYVQGNTLDVITGATANFAAAGNCAYDPTTGSKYRKGVVVMDSAGVLSLVTANSSEQDTKELAQADTLTYPDDKLAICEVVLYAKSGTAGDIEDIQATAEDLKSYIYKDVRPFLNLGGSQTFKTVSVATQSDIVADAIEDTLTFVGGDNIQITTNASTDTITIAATGGTIHAQNTDTGTTSDTFEINTDGNGVTLSTSGLSADRIFTFPDSAGTIAITSNLSSYQPVDAGLTSIAGLTTAADKMIYTTASDIYAVTALTSTARSLLDDANTTTMRATLELGDLATQNAASVPALTMAGNIGMGTSYTVTGLAAPSADTDATTKIYVDNAIAGLKWKASVKAASTAAATLSSDFANNDIIDGVTLSTGDRILVKDQELAKENGIYIVTAGTPTRATDANSEAELIASAVFVEQGTVNADTAYVCSSNTIPTIDTSAINFVQFAGSQSYQAGSGISFSGNQINVGAGTGITVGADAVAHYDYAGPADVDNSNGTFIQDINLDEDGLGHIEGITSVDLDGRYYTETESDTNFVNVSGDTMTGTITLSPASGHALVTTAGNVGISQTSPTYKLDVTGDLRTTAGAYFATTSGNVGVGTTNPSALLSVGATEAFKVTSAGVATWSGGGSANANTAYTHSIATTGTVHGLTLADVSQIGQTIESAEITDSTITAADIAAGAITKSKLDELRPFAQSTPDMTVHVNEGKIFVAGNTLKEYAGGNTASLTAPATNPKIALVSLTSAGALNITYGSEAAEPAAPAYPADEIPIAEVYMRTSSSAIYNTDQGAGTSYLYKDVRPFLNLGGSGTTDNIFKTIAVSGQSSVVADANSDTLTLVAGSNISLVTNATDDSITIDTTGGAPHNQNTDTMLDSGTVTVDASDNVSINTSQLYIQQADGNVGIGTATPAQKLHVEGQCVTGDTLLPVIARRPKADEAILEIASASPRNDKVEYVQIKDVQPGMLVYSLNEELGIIEPRRINALLDMGVKPVFKLTTEDGRTIRTTANHPYLTIEGWRKVMELKAGEEIAVPKVLISASADRNSYNEKMSILPVKYNAVISDPKTVNFSLFGFNSIGKMEGVARRDIMPHLFNNSFLNFYREFSQLAVGMLSEAITNHFMPNLRSISFEDTRPDFLDSSISFQNPGLRASNSSSSSSSVCLSSTNPNVAPFLSMILTTRSKGNDNLNVLDFSNRTIISFNKGITIVLSPFDLVEQLYHSLDNLSSKAYADFAPPLPAHLTEAYEFSDMRVMWNLFSTSMSRAESTPLSLRGRSEATDEAISWVRIASIEYVGYEQVYDIEVEGTHNFVAGHWVTSPVIAREPRRGDRSNLKKEIASLISFARNDKWFGGIIAHNTYMNGNVGISQTSPTYKLDVTGDLRTTAGAYFATTSGNVGVGTTGPGAPLQVYKTSPAADQVIFQAGTSDDATRFYIDEDGDVGLDGTLSAANLNATTQLQVGGVQIDSGDLSDVDSIAMLDEAETITGNWVNTANPWADDEVSDTLTASIYKGTGSTTDAVDLATAEVAGTLPDANIASTIARDSEVTSAISTHAALTATHGVSGAIVGTSDSQTLTTKAIDADNNTISNLETDNFKSSAIGTATTLGSSDSVLPTQNAVKVYVDNSIAGLKWKSSVRLASTANADWDTAFDNGSSVDGVVLATGDRILIKDQTDQTKNGIYIVPASGAPTTRAADANENTEVKQMAVFIEEGTLNSDTAWVMTNNDAAITLGTTSLAFAQFAGSQVFQAGSGISFSGNQINVGAGTGITVGADAVAHYDYAGPADVDNSNGTFIQDINLDEDGLGHIEGITSVDLDGRYYTETESDTNFVNVSGDTTTGTLTLSPASGHALVTTAGNVGISQTSPTYKLDVTGDLRTTAGAYFATTSGNVGVGTTGPTANLNIYGNLSTALANTVSVTNLSPTVTGTAFDTELAVGDAIKIGTETFTVSAIGSATSLTLDTAYQGATNAAIAAYKDSSLFLVQNGDGTAKVTIDKSGALTLGSTKITGLATPTADTDAVTKAYVDTALGSGGAAGAATFTTLTVTENAYLRGNVSDDAGNLTLNDAVDISGNLAVDTSVLYVDTSTDRVGIGTTGPGYPLHVVGTIYASGNLYTTANLTVTGSGPHYFSNGNVGISQTSPTYKLDVTGDLRTTAGAYFATTSGNVGVGTTNPSVAKLQIQGGDVAVQTAQKFIVDSDDTADSYMTHSNANNYISFYIDGTECARFKKK